MPVEQTLDLLGELDGLGPVAPTYKVWLYPGAVHDIDTLTGLATLVAILQVHVVPGRLFADEVIAAGQLTSVGGRVLPVTVQGGSVFVDGAREVLADVEASNGNIHFIDEVLMP